MDLEVAQSDLAVFAGDAIVVPTNSYGLMAEGVAVRVKAVAGPAIEKEVVRSAPIAVGAAVVTDGGTLKARRVIHVPLVEQPGLRAAVESVRRATRAGLLAANHFQLASIAIPGMGYGENGIPYDEAARAMIDELRAFKAPYPTRVTLVDLDPQMVAAFTQEIEDR